MLMHNFLYACFYLTIDLIILDWVWNRLVLFDSVIT